MGADALQERVLSIRRTAAVMKGGRRFSFSALVVVGDGRGRVGYGYSKAKEVPQAVEKAVKIAKKNLITVPFWKKTIPHEVVAKYRASRVMLRPAVEGTGIVAGQTIRAVMSLCGYQDILTKAFGNTNPINLLKATFEAIRSLRSRQDIERLRGVRLSVAGGRA
ncbi:MAG: 30S ribosomal protein S5 [Planctomycetota bacterium]